MRPGLKWLLLSLGCVGWTARREQEQQIDTDDEIRVRRVYGHTNTDRLAGLMGREPAGLYRKYSAMGFLAGMPRSCSCLAASKTR